MTFKSRFLTASILLVVLGQITLPEVADALVPKQVDGGLESLTFSSETLQANPQFEAVDIRVTTAEEIVSTWDSFRVEHGNWSAVIDKRTGKIESAEGQGIPFVPGHGNRLEMKDISADLGDNRAIDLTTMEAITRTFLLRVSNLLGVEPSTLVLNQSRSGHPADYLWFVDFDVTIDGIPVEGARVVFRVNNGNLIQFGSENLPAAGTEVPMGKVTRNQALKVLAAYIEGFSAADSFIDGGSQHFIPVALADSQFADGFVRGQGRGLARVWQFIFRRNGEYGTWRARIDATSGTLLEFRDLNDYVSAQVAGGVRSITGAATLPMPFADVSPGVYTNSAGVYDYTGAPVSSTLNGQYVKINDTCGPISMASDTAGNLALGTSTGTDCDTPGFGGAGNTNSSRTQFYHINRAKEIARGWLSLAWLTNQLTVNVNATNSNGDGICNSFWNGTALNLSPRSSSCSNSGEIQGVGLHEFGHGLDANDGSPLSDKGTGETYGDWTAALITHASCIGNGLLKANCDGFGDACTSCTGVRDIDYAKHASGTPHTVGNFTKVFCPTSSTYTGPCGREGHCESQVSSEALWDLAFRDLPNPGTRSAWLTMDRLWYLSRPTATAAFTCVTTTSVWSSNGCGTGSLWKILRAVDDDDGNLSNGTPHSGALYSAFNRHGIACTSDVGANTSFRGCTQPAPPSASVAVNNNSVVVTWSGSVFSGERYDVYRNEQGCSEGGFIKVANDFATLRFADSAVANDYTYYYQVVAQPGSNNEACASAPSTCLEATPCVKPAWPTALTAKVVNDNQIDLSWPASSGATRYHIYRAIFPDEQYTRIGTQGGTTFSDTGLSSCTSYIYNVRGAKSEACESIYAAGAFITTSGSSCPFTVRTETGGTGRGTVTSSPAGIDCGADCVEQYPFNTQVTLTATPAEGSYFYGWSGKCTGTGACVMTQTGSVAANFSTSPYFLLITVVSLNGTGTIMSTPGTINCDSRCGDLYLPNTQVTLTATPAAGYMFSGWSGGGCRGVGTCTVTINDNVTVTASFIQQPQELTVRSAGAGNGTINVPAGLYGCGADCQAYYYNSGVLLTATPAVGSVFTGWSGDCTGTGTCTVTMTQARFVTATFSVATYSLAVDLAGAGTGIVTSMSAGIKCGADCTEAYDYNTPVTLIATPDAGSVFDGWSGDCSGTTTTCAMNMTQFRLAVATFSVNKGQDFYTVKPCRILDTRVNGTTLSSEVPLIINVAGTCGVSPTAKAVSLNLTAVMASGQGFITLYPGDITLPGTWTISFSPLLNRANNAVIPLAWNGDGTLAALAAISGGGTVDMILDVTGYYE